MIPDGWVEPSLAPSTAEVAVRIVSPESLAGRLVVGGLEADACGEPWENGVCGLVSGHHGEHWPCTPELVDLAGPFCIAKVADE